MTYTPVLPTGGYAGWAFLKRTMAQQTRAFETSPAVKRDEAYFRENIGKIETAEQLVNDPRLLRVALGAFGLQADTGNKFFIQKILEGGTLRPDALANRLANKQYQKLASTFGFGNVSSPRTKLSDFAEKIIAPYKSQQFSIAVGSQNDDMRLALNVERELPDLANSSASSVSKWYSILGSPPLRVVFERAFNLPTAFGAIDIDKQVEILQRRAESMFGSSDLSQFNNPDTLDKLVRGFLLQSELAASGPGFSTGQIALTLLQQSRVGVLRL